MTPAGLRSGLGLGVIGIVLVHGVLLRGGARDSITGDEAAGKARDDDGLGVFAVAVAFAAAPRHTEGVTLLRRFPMLSGQEP